MIRPGLIAACLLVLGGCRSDETVSAFTEDDRTYRLTELNGAAFSADATLSFPEPGRVAGRGPCNGFSATQSVPYPWFDLGAIAATKRACPDLAEEARYFDALTAATIVEVSGDTLILTDDDGLQMVFQARN